MARGTTRGAALSPSLASRLLSALDPMRIAIEQGHVVAAPQHLGRSLLKAGTLKLVQWGRERPERFAHSNLHQPPEPVPGRLLMLVAPEAPLPTPP